MCVEGSNIFTQGAKVQVTGNQEMQTEMFIALADSDIHMRKTGKSSDGIAAGTELTAIVKNSCNEPGEISANIERDSNFEGKSGERSYPYIVDRDMTRVELEDMAENDGCLVGLSDSAVDYVHGMPTDPMVSKQRHFKNIKASEAYPTFFNVQHGTRPMTVIAIVDTGVELSHPDLAPNLWVNDGEIAGNKIDDDHNGYIDDVNGYNMASRKGNPNPEGSWKGNYHGTHVAGLAAARAGNDEGGTGVMGVGARIMALNVFGSNPGALSYNTENAIRYAADNGADVINLSIGGTSASASYKAAIQYAVAKGVTIVAAAGNESRQLGPNYFLTPGAYGQSINGMLTIGSIDSEDTTWSYYSNYSPTYVEIAAPGSEDSGSYVGLLSTMPGGKYSRLQGTSMATPVMAGAAGLAIQLMRALGYAPTPSRIESALTASGRAVAKLTAKVKGGKVLDLKSLADYIVRTYPKRTAPEPGTYNKLAANGGVPTSCM